jgi:hypothetical protein
MAPTRIIPSPQSANFADLPFGLTANEPSGGAPMTEYLRR